MRLGTGTLVSGVWQILFPPKMPTTIFLVLPLFLEPWHPSHKQVESESPSSILGGTL